MNEIQMRFNMERRKGGMQRVIERGKKGIEKIVSFKIMKKMNKIMEFEMKEVILDLEYGM